MFSVVVVVVLRELIARPLLNLADLLLVLIGVPADFARRRLRPEQLTTKPTVAIVGGGFSGLWAQRALSDDYDVTIVDFKDYFIRFVFTTLFNLFYLTNDSANGHHTVVQGDILTQYILLAALFALGPNDNEIEHGEDQEHWHEHIANSRRSPATFTYRNAAICATGLGLC